MKNLKLIIAFIVVFFVGVLVGSAGSSAPVNEVAQHTTTDNTATKAPRKEEGKVEVKSDTKTLNSGYTKVVGEVINNTSLPVTYVKVTATFYDSDKKVVGTNFSYVGDTSDTPLAPAATAPFEVTSYPEKVNADSYKLDVSWR